MPPATLSGAGGSEELAKLCDLRPQEANLVSAALWGRSFRLPTGGRRFGRWDPFVPMTLFTGIFAESASGMGQAEVERLPHKGIPY